mmetsp:Transcript_23592/g.29734  ORF Transcript_23592/g.29734 Transcript_23592/m.29734 type:complete len:114 (+) Transcript_23592:114-455(+)
MNLLFNRVAKISALALIVSLPMAAPMGYNTRTDMLHTVNHKEEIDSLLNKKYTGDAAPGGSQIHQVKEVVSSETDLKLSRRALGLTAKNGTYGGIGFSFCLIDKKSFITLVSL